MNNVKFLRRRFPSEFRFLESGAMHLERYGFLSDTTSHFKLGYCSHGRLAGRVVFPFHDRAGEVVDFVGLRVKDQRLEAGLGSSLRECGGRGSLRFRRSPLLYHANEISTDVRQLIVVHGFQSVWRLWQHGHKNTVGIVERSCVAEHARQLMDLIGPGGCLWIVSEGSRICDKLTAEMLGLLADRLDCRILSIPDGRLSGDLSDAQLRYLFI